MSVIFPLLWTNLWISSLIDSEVTVSGLLAGLSLGLSGKVIQIIMVGDIDRVNLLTLSLRQRERERITGNGVLIPYLLRQYTANTPISFHLVFLPKVQRSSLTWQLGGSWWSQSQYLLELSAIIVQPIEIMKISYFFGVFYGLLSQAFLWRYPIPAQGFSLVIHHLLGYYL